MTALVIGLMLLGPPPEEAPAERMREIFRQARVPNELWDEFASVSWCESRWDSRAIGDSGSAVGLFQIHPMWIDWAYREGYGIFSRLNPVDNTRLAYLIGEHYDKPRGSRWRQWSAKPWFSSCQEFPRDGWEIEYINIPGAI